MNHSLKNQECRLSPGDVIEGKWHKNRYEIVKQLGYGATGYVYLAKSRHGLVALKISENNMAITSEVNVLRHFSKVQGGVALGPSLLDVDDLVYKGKNYPFYIMEYLKGQDLFSFLQNHGKEWFQVLILQLLADLDQLHKEGWVFGDLKPENLLIVGPPPKIRWLDVGGTTIIGRSIKEYTEFYDRGYWGMGSRKAEPAYDLFAVAMIMIQTQYPKRFVKKENTLQQLSALISERQQLRPYKPVILKAIEGKYTSAIQMRKELLLISDSRSKTNQLHSRQKYQMERRKKEKGSKKHGVLETLLIATIMLLGYILYIFGQYI